LTYHPRKSNASPRRFLRIGQFDVDRPQAENCDDDRLLDAGGNAVVMEGARRSLYETARGTVTALPGSKSAPLFAHQVPDRTIWMRSVA